MTVHEFFEKHESAGLAFAAWARARFPRITPAEVLASLQPATWKAFCRSEEGKSLEGETHLAALTLGTPTLPRPAVVPPVEREPQQPTPTRTIHLSESTGPFSQPLPQQSPPAPTSSNPLVAMIATELDAMGYRAGVDEAAVRRITREVIGELDATPSRVFEVRTPTTTRQIEGQAPAWFGRLLRLHACRVPALLVGPAGSGKTTAAEMLAQAVGAPFHRLSIAAGTDEGQLQGWLLPVGEQMRFEYVASQLSRAYEEGGVVLIDDIDLGDANALGILNAALDNGPWHVALRHEAPAFTRDKDFYILGAANTWGHGADRQFVGANQLDERTLSRFRAGQIPCDYDPELERKLFQEPVTTIGHLLRKRCRAAAGLRRDVSTRDMASWQKMAGEDADGHAPFTLREALYGWAADWPTRELEQIDCIRHDTTMELEVL